MAAPEDPGELQRLMALFHERLDAIRLVLETKRRKGWCYDPRRPGVGSDPT
jgi:hypothetical protein